MNLLAKIKNCGVLLMGLAIFNSCEEKGGFGIATDDVAPVTFSTTEVPLEASVVLTDSVITSESSLALFGQINNSPFGSSIVATGYMALSANVNNQPGLPPEAVLDSVKINFKIAYLFDSSDVKRTLNIEVYPITEEFYDTLYIASNTLSIGTDLLASGQFEIEDLDSTYSIDVTANWASDIFEEIRAESENVTSQDKFEEYFPGFAFKTPATNENIFAIQTGANFEVVFYYTRPNEDNTENVNRSFVMTAVGEPNFYNISVDRIGSDFAPIVEYNTAYDNTSLLGVQAATGLLTKLDFSELAQFSSTYPDVIVNLAELSIGPIDDFPEGQSPPISLSFYLTDNRNTRIIDGNSFRAMQGDGTNPIGNTNPVRFFYNSETKTYVGSITTFVKAYQSGDLTRNDYLIYPSELFTSLKGFTITRDKLKLKIFYSEVN